MPPNTLQLANKHGLGWGGAWDDIDDAMHFSAAKGEGGAFQIRRGFIPDGPSSTRTDGVPSIEADASGQVTNRDRQGADYVTPSNIDDTRLPGAQNADGSARGR